MTPRTLALKRLLARSTRRESGCLEFTGSTRTGYSRIWVNDGTVRALIPGHRLVMEAHLGRPIPDGLIVRHRCDNPPCVAIEHLELGTHYDNSRDKCERGRSNFGTRNGISKLTEQTASDARSLLVQGWSQADVARHLGVSKSCINLLAQNKTWKHIEPTPATYKPDPQKHSRKATA